MTRLPQTIPITLKISIGVLFSSIGVLFIAPFWTDQTSSAVPLIMG